MKLKRFKNLKLKNKLLLTLIPLVVVIYSITTIVVFKIADSNLTEMARENAKATAAEHGNEVKSQMMSFLQTARGLATQFSKIDMYSPEQRRNIVSEILQKTLADNAAVMGTWAVWEPNAVDGNDALSPGKPGADATGRFAPYWNRVGGIHIETCVDFNDGNPNGEFYLRSKRTKKEVIMEPVTYKINNENTMVVSLTVPIIINDQLRGVAGVDISMTELQRMINAIKPYENSYGILLANNGMFVAHPADKVIGVIIGDEDKHENKEKIRSDIKEGRSFEIEKISVKTKLLTLISFVPFEISKDNGPWCFAMSIPFKVFLDRNDQILYALLITGILSILVFGVIIYIVANAVANPIINITNASRQLAAGNTNIDLKADSEDESGVLSASFLDMSHTLNNLIDDIHSIAGNAQKGNLSYRGDASKYNGAYRDLIQGFNDALNAIIGPLNVSAEYVDRISKGDIPHKITENYQGDFNGIKNNLNQCIDAVNLLISDSDKIYQAVKVGDMQTKADRTQHQGDFRKVMDGIMNTLDIIDESFTENIRVISEMEQGNLSVRYQGNFLGSFAVLQNAMNETLEKLPFKETMQVMSKIANGDLSVKITGDYKGESKELKDAINQTIDSLNDILSNVRNTVDEVTRGAMQVSDASTALSQGATQQAASLEEITSSMSEIGSQTRHNAENSNMANALSVEARDSAEKGYKEMMLLNDAMTEISESSKNISKIIKVIDEIAFQTNLLALNAAVEAARAGRHGKGFAVVAEEVRNLAARSATAAKETAELIENSIKTVERGTDLTMKTGDALEEIKNSSVKVADIIGEITTSSNEQAQGISQINEGLTQIDKVTQTNTASAEQSASAAEELSGQAGMLRELVTRFKLADGGSLSMSYSKPRMNGRNTNQRALPSARKQTSSHGISEDDLMDMVEESIAADEKRNTRHNPKDIINLEDDNFGRY